MEPGSPPPLLLFGDHRAACPSSSPSSPRGRSFLRLRGWEMKVKWCRRSSWAGCSGSGHSLAVELGKAIPFSGPPSQDPGHPWQVSSLFVCPVHLSVRPSTHPSIRLFIHSFPSTHSRVALCFWSVFILTAWYPSIPAVDCFEYYTHCRVFGCE